MSRFSFRLSAPAWWGEGREFFKFLRRYGRGRGYVWFSKFEVVKDVLVDLLYKQRGKYTRPFLHFGTIALAFFIITFGPLLLQRADEERQAENNRALLNNVGAVANAFSTIQAEEVRAYRGGEITAHIVREGETFSSIAERYGLQVDTILWENNLDEKAKIKPGQELRILPVDGIRHKVARGETIFTIGKKYGLDDESQIQLIVDYPFNEFLNDETFELATGQYLMVPDGVKPQEVAVARPRTTTGRLTPDAGAVTATGSFVWPAAGIITQGYRFYHKAYDIANRAGGPIYAADAGTVTSAGWTDNSGYANKVIIDHGGGRTTLYAHLSVVQVKAGQRVNRGDVLGQMGCTGRCTGTHLHFEVRQGGALLDPGSFLK
jgi:murein DD-endopeptidase MepM/ murein hydrolase activator NlpD